MITQVKRVHCHLQNDENVKQLPPQRVLIIAMSWSNSLTSSLLTASKFSGKNARCERKKCKFKLLPLPRHLNASIIFHNFDVIFSSMVSKKAFCK